MPEGDTLFRAAAALHRALAGLVITGFDTAYAHLARVHDDRPIPGRTVERCRAVGKHVLIHLSGGLVLRTHMRLSGSWHLYRPAEPWRRPVRAMRVRLDTDPWVAVAFDVPDAEFLLARDLPRHPVLAALGPDLLSGSCDRGDALRRLAAAGARPIGDVLLDQRVVAGIGNVYRSEILFLAGVHPDRTAGSLTDAERASILDIAVSLMRQNATCAPAAAIGFSRGPRRTTRLAAPGAELWVYGRAGRPCRRCGTPVQTGRRGPWARAVYWCPACQRPAPA